jgi:glucokinase
MIGRMLLAGDLGGTKSLLGLFQRADAARPEEVRVLEFATLEYPGAGPIVKSFLDATGVAVSAIEAASLGLPGPVIDQRVKPTNVDWTVDARDLMKELGLRRVELLNDLEAMAHVVPALRPNELKVLQNGQRDPKGNAALLAAGTGLGQALLINVDGELRPSASEGGHADFAARTPREIELLKELTGIYGRAHTEHVVCGPGLVNVARFTSQGQSFVFREAADPSELPWRITQAALSRRCAHCVEALEMFVAAFGAAAGNFAMQGMATGGVYIGGGIPPKILPAFETSTFIDAFNAKEPLDGLVKAMPVFLILNKHAGLDGAAVHANRLGR